MITRLRRNGRNLELWNEFRSYIEANTPEVCRNLDTRWLVSVCDTYVDYGDELTRRNAMLVVQIVNFEKLWATYLLMYDLHENPDKIRQIKNNKVIPLWDGVYSFNINHGDMTNNLFHRLDNLMQATPEIKAIYYEILKRMKERSTVLSRMDEYHRRLFEPYPRRSLLRILRRKIRMLIKSYKI